MICFANNLILQTLTRNGADAIDRINKLII